MSNRKEEKNRAVPDHPAMATLKEANLQEMSADDRADLLEKVKDMLGNNNWPESDEIRSQLWRLISMDINFFANKLIFSEEIEKLKESKVTNLSSSLTSGRGAVTHNYGLKERGDVTLEQFLIIIQCTRPELKVVPILYPLSALMLHYLSPEESYAAVIRLLDSDQEHRFLLQTELASIASSKTLLSLLEEHENSIYNHLDRLVNGDDPVDKEALAKIFDNWQAWIFKKLPLEYVVRVVDCFLLEGHKMLMCIALGLTCVWHKKTMEDQPIDRMKFEGMSVDERIAEVAGQIAETAEQCPVSVQTLLDVGCSIRNLKQSTIERLQKEHELDLQDHVTKLENERPAQRSPHFYSIAFSSKILDANEVCEVIALFPDRFRLSMPKLLYRRSEHGTRFSDMWPMIDEAEQTLFVIKTTKGEVFGAYCSSCWAECRDRRDRSQLRFFGVGESFVWKLDRTMGLPIAYKWKGHNYEDPDDEEEAPPMFQTGTEKSLIIGSGGGDAIHITGELTSGMSYPCEACESPALVDKHDFTIDEMEVFNVL